MKFEDKFDHVFVFGSNLAGRHGAGAAKTALEKYGAIYGQGIGKQGNSYGIPTKDRNINSLPLQGIKFHVDEFIQYVKGHREERFYVTKIGCGLAGYTNKDIAPMFKHVPDNCYLAPEWNEILGRKE